MSTAPGSTATVQIPESWSAWRSRPRSRLMVPFALFNWLCRWGLYHVEHWAVLQLLDKLAKLSVVVVVALYFWEASDRTKEKHYRAWQVINDSQGKSSTGGRIDALEDLIRDKVSLEYIQLPTAQLGRLRAIGANLASSDLRAAFLYEAKLDDAYLAYANLRNAYLGGARLRNGRLHHANLASAAEGPCWANPADQAAARAVNSNACRTDLRFADFTGANLNRATLNGALALGTKFVRANLAGADLSDVNFANADLTDAILIDAKLDGAALGTATFCRTTMPDRTVAKPNC